mmetsp:Transcript_39550/g.93103  ORF Transcript_39550/g.93103 Transcript_39550/m.93103 type:complete len:224 (+) Transcript_39550:99-770(+)
MGRRYRFPGTHGVPRRGQAGEGMSRAEAFFKTKMCSEFLAGRCLQQDQCCFAHNAAELRQRPLDPLRIHLCPAFLSNQPCMNPDCKFAHTQEDARRLGKNLKDPTGSTRAHVTFGPEASRDNNTVRVVVSQVPQIKSPTSSVATPSRTPCLSPVMLAGDPSMAPIGSTGSTASTFSGIDDVELEEQFQFVVEKTFIEVKQVMAAEANLPRSQSCPSLRSHDQD